MLLLIIIVLVLLSFGSGFYRTDYRTPGFGIGTILLIILIYLLLTGGLGNIHL
jgi:hypothetical protein